MAALLGLYWQSVVGAALIALACSILGVYVVLRRVVFVGVTLAQLSSAGVALAAFLASAGVGLGLLTSRFVLALVLTVGGVALFAARRSPRGVPADARLGLVFVLAGAVTVLLLTRSATTHLADLFFGGDVLLIGTADLVRLGVVVLVVMALHAALAKELVLVSCDPEMASTLGYRVHRWNLLLYLSVAAVITVAMAAVGVLLTFSFLVLPPLCGLFLGRHLRTVFASAAGVAVAGTALGFLASLRLDLPTGATVIVVLGLLTVAAWVRAGRPAAAA